MKEGYVVPLREKIAFGIGDFGINIIYSATSLYLLYFAINVAGIPAKWVGGIFLGVNIYNAFLNYFVGMWSDRVNTKYGRKRPFILFGSIPYALLFVLLWFVPFEGSLRNMIYFAVVYFTFCTATTLVTVPYNSLMPELSQNYDERTAISGIRMGLTFVGNLLGAAGVALIVDMWFGGKEYYRTSYPIMGLILGIILLVSLLITFAGTKERVISKSEASGGIFKTIASIMKLRESRIAIAMFVTNLSGFTFIQGLLLFYLKDVLEMPEDLTFVLLGLPLIMAVVAAPLWVYAGEKFGKKNAYIIAALYIILAMALTLFLPSGSIVLTCLFCALAGIGLSATQILPFSIMPDVIEYDELANGSRREGAFYGVAFSFLAVLTGVVIWITSSLMGLFGYVENSTTTQPESALLCIRIMAGIGPGLFFAAAAIFVKMLPITKKSHEEVKRQLEERRASETLVR